MMKKCKGTIVHIGYVDCIWYSRTYRNERSHVDWLQVSLNVR